MLDLVCYGRAALDVYGAQSEPPYLQDLLQPFLGGSPANVAVGAARLGLRVGLITATGDDPAGHFVRDRLAAEGVTVHGPRDPNRNTPLFFVAPQDEGRYRGFPHNVGAPDLAMDPDQLDPRWSAGARALFLTATSLSAPGSRAVAARLMASAEKVVLDLDHRAPTWKKADLPYREALADISKRVDIVTGTAEELEAAGGLDMWFDGGSTAVVVHDGARDATLYRSGEEPVAEPPPPIDPIDRLGAGDSFAAALVWSWLRGDDLTEAMRWALAAGAWTVGHLGCAAAMPTLAELERLRG